jgi:hypothetical protein
VEVVEAHPQLTLVEFEVEHGATFPFHSPKRVVVTVGYPPGTEPSTLVNRIYDRVTAINEGPFGLGFGDDLHRSALHAVESTDGVKGTNGDE